MTQDFRTRLLHFIPECWKTSTIQKLDTINDSQLKTIVTVSVSLLSLFSYKLLYTFPSLLTLIATVYPIHMTITYMKTDSYVHHNKLIMTWFYFTVWGNASSFLETIHSFVLLDMDVLCSKIMMMKRLKIKWLHLS